MVAISNLQTTIAIPTDLNSDQRAELGKMVVEFIVNRTRNRGLDRNNVKFASYNKEYYKSGTMVDLTETGDTLDDIKLISHSIGRLVIGYEKGYYQAERVEGLRRGARGRKGVIGNPKKARDYLGISSQDLSLLVEKVRQATLQQLEEKEQFEDKLESLSSRLINRIFREQGLL